MISPVLRRFAFAVIAAALLGGCQTLARPAPVLTLSDYPVAVDLGDTRWSASSDRIKNDSNLGRYHWAKLPDRTHAADVEMSYQHTADVPPYLADLTVWSQAMFENTFEDYTGGYRYVQEGETISETATLGSGQPVTISHSTYNINGHRRHVATAVFEDDGVRGFVWVYNTGTTERIESIVPMVLNGISLTDPAAP